MTSRQQFWILAAAAAFLLLGPIRLGDLAGYDDAVYAHIAKGLVKSGDWLDIRSNDYPALEHPPGFVWLQAVSFSLFGGLTENWDFLAKLPSALAGVGVVLLVYWIALRISADRILALLAMFIMLATPYFIKYTSHGMTDIPFTFWFAASMAAWLKAQPPPKPRRASPDGEDRPPADARGSVVFYVLSAAMAAMAMLTRGVVGLAVPATLLLWTWIPEKWRGAPSPNRAIATIVMLASVIPLILWYTYQAQQNPELFWQVQTAFLADKIGGGVAGTWRQFTGAPEYLWMLVQSYWPWLPFLAIGIWGAGRTVFSTTDTAKKDEAVRKPGLSLLFIWSAVMFAACSVGGSRVLRYLLPAYPAFSILAALGLVKLVGETKLRLYLRWAIPMGLVVAIGIAILPPVSLHAAEIRPIAVAASDAAAPEERIGFWDAGQGRFDETAQIQWYGDRALWILTDPARFDQALNERWSSVWVVDEATYQSKFAGRTNARVIARSGNLVVVKLERN